MTGNREQSIKKAQHALNKAQDVLNKISDNASTQEYNNALGTVNSAKKIVKAFFYTQEDYSKIILDSLMKSFLQVCTTSKRHTTYELAKKHAHSYGKKYVIACPLCKKFHMEQTNHEFAASSEAKLRKLFTHYFNQNILNEEQYTKLLLQAHNAFIDYGRIYYSWVVVEKNLTAIHNRKGVKKIVIKQPSVKRNVTPADVVVVMRNSRVSKVSLEGINKQVLTEFYRCGRKRYFAFESEAKTATLEAQIDRIRHSVDGVLAEPEMTYYLCNYCTGYHLGHTSPEPHKDPPLERLIETWNLYAARNERFLVENNIPVVLKQT